MSGPSLEGRGTAKRSAAAPLRLRVPPEGKNLLFDRPDALPELSGICAKPSVSNVSNTHQRLLEELRRADEKIGTPNFASSNPAERASAFYKRGIVLRNLGRFEEAVASYDMAVASDPKFVDAYVQRGDVLYIAKRLDGALASYNRALEIKPDLAQAFCGISRVYRDRGQIRQAVSCLTHALGLQPANPDIHLALIFTRNFDPTASSAELQTERRAFAQKFASHFRQVVAPFSNDPDPNRRLRIGYVSPHFRAQASAYAFGGALLNHDKSCFEIICYSDTLDEDSATARFRAGADCWHQTIDLSDDALANLIRNDRIDILVDLAGYQSGNRLLVFARKPAPIQVTAWGEPTGTGLQAMDYLLADPVLVPHSERTQLTERVADLPNFLGYWNPEPLPEPGPLPALAKGHVTFGSFSRVAKITNATIRAWASILRALPTAMLVLKGPDFADAGSRQRVSGGFATLGIPATRLTLLGGSDRDAHFAAYRDIDIALDPFPHGGGMTTLDALYMGVPVVAWQGPTISSRLAAASLTALGLTDFIAPSQDAYVDLAVATAANSDALARLRAGLRSRLEGSEFGNAARYSRAVEAAYRAMWLRWCADRSSHA